MTPFQKEKEVMQPGDIAVEKKYLPRHSTLPTESTSYSQRHNIVGNYTSNWHLTHGLSTSKHTLRTRNVAINDITCNSLKALNSFDANISRQLRISRDITRGLTSTSQSNNLQSSESLRMLPTAIAIRRPAFPKSSFLRTAQKLRNHRFSTILTTLTISQVLKKNRF